MIELKQSFEALTLIPQRECRAPYKQVGMQTIHVRHIKHCFVGENMSVFLTKARSSHPPSINDKAAAVDRQNPMELAGQFLHVDKCRYDWLEDTRNGVSLPFIEAMYSPSSNISNLVWKWSVILTQLLSSQPIIEKLKKEIPQYLSRARGRQHVRGLGLL